MRIFVVQNIRNHETIIPKKSPTPLVTFITNTRTFFCTDGTRCHFLAMQWSIRLFVLWKGLMTAQLRIGFWCTWHIIRSLFHCDFKIIIPYNKQTMNLFINHSFFTIYLPTPPSLPPFLFFLIFPPFWNVEENLVQEISRKFTFSSHCLRVAASFP